MQGEALVEVSGAALADTNDVEVGQTGQQRPSAAPAGVPVLGVEVLWQQLENITCTVTRTKHSPRRRLDVTGQ